MNIITVFTHFTVTHVMATHLCYPCNYVNNLPWTTNLTFHLIFQCSDVQDYNNYWQIVIVREILYFFS